MPHTYPQPQKDSQKGKVPSKLKRKALRLELPVVMHSALAVYCDGHSCSLHAGVRKLLASALNLDGETAGNA